MAEFVDPYLDPETGLLPNLVGARMQDALDTAEGDLSYQRAAELQVRPVRATGDLADRQLFQDVYPWAGEVRTVDIRKNVAGAEHSCRSPSGADASAERHHRRDRANLRCWRIVRTTSAAERNG